MSDNARGIIELFDFSNTLPRVFHCAVFFLFFADAKNNRVQSAKFKVQLMNNDFGCEPTPDIPLAFERRGG